MTNLPESFEDFNTADSKVCGGLFEGPWVKKLKCDSPDTYFCRWA